MVEHGADKGRQRFLGARSRLEVPKPVIERDPPAPQRFDGVVRRERGPYECFHCHWVALPAYIEGAALASIHTASNTWPSGFANARL